MTVGMMKTNCPFPDFFLLVYFNGVCQLWEVALINYKDKNDCLPRVDKEEKTKLSQNKNRGLSMKQRSRKHKHKEEAQNCSAIHIVLSQRRSSTNAAGTLLGLAGASVTKADPPSRRPPQL